jgi:hypothetical protein
MIASFAFKPKSLASKVGGPKIIVAHTHFKVGAMAPMGVYSDAFGPGIRTQAISIE